MNRKFIPALALAFLLAACAAEDVSTPYNPPTPVVDHAPFIFDIDIDTPAAEERFNDPRPNIILIMTDDQPFHTVDYMPFIKTELMEHSVVFDNAFATTPLCCPSRVSILNGEYVHNHEVYTDRMPLGGAPKYDDSVSFALWLKEAGYSTAYFGKYLNGYDELIPFGVVPPGWDVWNAFLGKNLNADDDSGNLQFYFDFSLSENGSVVEYPRSGKTFSADIITDKALAYIRDSRDAPFFMAVSYYNPHSPYISAARHKETFRASTGWDWVQYRPPNFNEENIRDKPDYIGDLSPFSETEVDTVHKQILRSLLSVDDGVASIIKALEKAGLSEDTILIFTSDNGLTLGDHRFGATKNCPYEACIKVPFIVYAPGYFDPRVDANLIANIDLAPTFAEWTGAPIPETVDGVSMASLLEDPSSDWRDAILIEHWPTEEGVGSMIPEYYSIRTQEWKYTEYSTGEVELYDLVNDPYELQNVAGKSDYRDIQAELAAKLLLLKEE